jgi:penicillin-binding protein 1A
VGRRFGRAAAAILLVALGAAVVAWVATPDVNDAQARVDAEAARLKVPVLSPADVPEQLALAVVATEDERFYSHHGIDVPGIVRAVVDDVAMRCLCEGGSTITEQLIKEVYLNGSNMGFNKLVDVILAFKVESVLDKPRILADWLTLAPTGPTRYGVAPTRWYSRRSRSLPPLVACVKDWDTSWKVVDGYLASRSDAWGTSMIA